ncbi:MAG: dienelactone hydrolase family protein [Armatimonas sp.]
MDYQSGQKTGSGYLALPAFGKGPGVLVLHAWWGLNPFFTALCDRLAAEGFVALCPDLYDGKLANTQEEANALVSALDFDRAGQKAMEALDVLGQYASVPDARIGALGCSMGANWAVMLSTMLPEKIAAAVLFYGVSDGDFSKANCDYLCHFGTEDEWDPVEQAREMAAAIQAAGKSVTLYEYPGAGHWFFEENQEGHFKKEAAELAWERTVPFLKERLS